MRLISTLLGCLTLGAALLAAAGCGSRAQQFTPAPQTARASLEAALEQWKAGSPPGRIACTPPVEVADASRLAGQTLRSFEVLGETSLGAEGRCFIVRLALDNPAAELRARFVVVGIDPIWVFRKEDYDHLAHWEHPMPETAAPAKSENPVLEAGDPPAAAISPPSTDHERS